MADKPEQDWQQFIDYYDTVRGWIRERLTQEYLTEHLPDRELCVMDVGGGDGRDAVWLAGMGYQVTLLEPAADMLERAHMRAEKNRVDLDFIQGSDSLLGWDDLCNFDLTLSHGVMMYCDDPAEHIKALAASVKTGGLVSLLTNNYGGARQKLKEKGVSHDELDELARTHRNVNNIGVEVWAHERSEIIPMLTAAGLEVLQIKGVRSHYDYDNRCYAELYEIELERILADERHLGADESYMDEKAQMLHFIARKQ